MDKNLRQEEERKRQFRQLALDYHALPSPGKISVMPTKNLSTQRDLALAYSPGVAAACEEIAQNPLDAARYTARANLVAVITNGSAVLGLGNIGPLASKPVMEGKGVLFKKFAGINVFDIEVNESDPEKLCEIIAALEPTFGGINLEDIKAPECFYIEETLRERMKIPVFHDDQHGTAIIVAAAIFNGLKIVGKTLAHCKMVVSGAGAAALACLELLVDMGFPLENIFMSDLAGVVYAGRTELMDPKKARFARPTNARTLTELLVDADIFLGLSAGGIVQPDMIKPMAARPLIFSLANPTPEITPEAVRTVRDDAIIATGRSDYPNQVNNVLCFPYIFRGALDCGATTITRSMEIATVQAIAALARAEASDMACDRGDTPSFGPDYLIPQPFDPRLIIKIAPAVAKAAMDAGVATRPIADLPAYKANLQEFVYRSGTFMRPLFQIAKNAPANKRRIVYAEGEDERVLRAAQIVIDDHLARPIFIGRPAVLAQRIARFGLRMQHEKDYDIINPEFDTRYRDYWQTYLSMTQRQGVSEQYAKLEMRRRHTLIGAMTLHKGEADGMICGTYGTTELHLHYINQVLGRCPGVSVNATMNVLILEDRHLAVVDTHVNLDPSATQLADITLLAAAEMRNLGFTPRIALLSHSNFGTGQNASSQKMREVLALVRARAPHLEIDGEMHGDTALDIALLQKTMPDTPLTRAANLLVMPNLDAANIAYNLIKKIAAQGVSIGPILLGCCRPVHVLTPATTVRRIVNMSALCVAEAVWGKQ